MGKGKAKEAPCFCSNNPILQFGRRSRWLLWRSRLLQHSGVTHRKAGNADEQIPIIVHRRLVIPDESWLNDSHIDTSNGSHFLGDH